MSLLEERRSRWMAARAARRALFSRPTPVASRLVLAARLHRLVDLLSWSVTGLSALRLLVILGPPLLIPELSGLVLGLSEPLVWGFNQLFPAVARGPAAGLEPGVLLAILWYWLVNRLLHRLVTRVAYGRDFRQLRLLAAGPAHRDG